MVMYVAIRSKKGQLLEAVGWGKRPRSKDLLGEVWQARIPPQWMGVMVDPEPGAKVIAQGLDSKGRLQRLYSTEHREGAAEQKFERVEELIANYEVIKAELQSDIRDRSYMWFEEAVVAYLIFVTGIRPGSQAETGGEYRAFGATTLLMTHVKVKASGRVWLDFIGKKGVRIKQPVKDKWLCQELTRRKARASSYKEQVFKTSASTLNKYFGVVGGGNYSAKDFRTMRGCMMAHELLDNRRVPKGITARKRIVREAIKQVAKALGNTPAVAKSAYIDPSILSRWGLTDA